MTFPSKQEARAALLAGCKAIPAPEQARQSAQICNCLQALPCYANAQNILFYYPCGEPDILPLAKLALEQKKTVCFPKILPGSNLCAVLVHTLNDFIPGPYGIAEPVGKPLPEKELQLLLIPLVGFTPRLIRLGRGKGFYDRFLPLCKGLRLGIAFAGQQANFPVLPHDTPLDAVLTPENIYWKEGM